MRFTKIVCLFIFMCAVAFTACDKNTEHVAPVDAAILDQAQIITLSDLQKLGDIEIIGDVVVPEDAQIYLFNSELFSNAVDAKNPTDLKTREIAGPVGPDGPEPDCNAPDCDVAIPAAVAALQPLANQYCETMYTCVACCQDGMGMLYAMIAVPPTVYCPVYEPVGIDEM